MYHAYYYSKYKIYAYNIYNLVVVFFLSFTLVVMVNTYTHVVVEGTTFQMLFLCSSTCVHDVYLLSVCTCT